MELWMEDFLQQQSLLTLLLILAIFIYILAKGGDILVEKAVSLAKLLHISPVVIGATIVSMGTTLPEATVSVMAAVNGKPDLALGNAVGSIICDTGLILGLSSIIGIIPINQAVVNKQGYIQLFSGLLLIGLCVTGSASAMNVFKEGGQLLQESGFLLISLLAIYFIWSYQFSRNHTASIIDSPEPYEYPKQGVLRSISGLVIGIAVVILASKILIPTASQIAIRLHVPEGIIAASLVAFGTSLPELVTAITSVRKGRGDLAIGNIIGADILNVLFVAGAAASVTPGGLHTPPVFFAQLFPFMLGILLLFRLGIYFSRDTFPRSFGYLLLVIYGLFLAVNSNSLLLH